MLIEVVVVPNKQSAKVGAVAQSGDALRRICHCLYLENYVTELSSLDCLELIRRSVK